MVQQKELLSDGWLGHINAQFSYHAMKNNISWHCTNVKHIQVENNFQPFDWHSLGPISMSISKTKEPWHG